MRGMTIFILAILLGIFGIMLWWNREHPFFTYDATAAGVLLTAAAVVLTGTAVVVAIIALFGFTEIRDRAVDAAVDAATKAAKERTEEIVPAVTARTIRDMSEKPGDLDNATKIAESVGGED